MSRGGNNKCAPTDALCRVPGAFAPRRPKSWSKRPNEWLTSDEIDRVLEQHADACPHFHYTGFGFIDFAADARTPLRPRSGFEARDPDAALPPPMDAAQLAKAQPAAQNPNNCVQPGICDLNLAELIRQNKFLVGSVLNVSRHVEEGTHWVFVLLFLPPPAAAAPPPQMVYFDSTAEPPPPEIVAWHAKLRNECAKIYPSSSFPPLMLRVNGVRRQKTDTECGMFALYAVVSMVQGIWLKDTADTAAAQCAALDKIPLMLDELLHKDTPITDEMVARYRSVLFNAATTTN